MGRAEVEHAASLIVRVCQVDGDTWKPVAWADVQRVLASDGAEGAEPFASLQRNPFFYPDVHALCARGFARKVGDGPGFSAELTEAGLAALAPWVRSEAD